MSQMIIYQKLIEKNVKYLVHFTEISNLESIMTNGLLSINSMDNDNIKYNNNDLFRFEGYPNSISLSIDFPNYQMFFKYRKQKNMVLLLLKPQLILEKECLYFYKNAASSEFRNNNINIQNSIENFEKMYAQSIDNIQRSPLIPNNYTTHPQAEILCLNSIEPSYIDMILYKDRDDWNSFNKTYPFIRNYQEKSYINTNIPKYFSYRDDWELWKL